MFIRVNSALFCFVVGGEKKIHACICYVQCPKQIERMRLMDVC